MFSKELGDGRASALDCASERKAAAGYCQNCQLRTSRAALTMRVGPVTKANGTSPISLVEESRSAIPIVNEVENQFGEDKL